MKNLSFKLVIYVFITNLTFANEIAQLQFDNIFFASKKVELSGMALKDGDLFLIGDKLKDHYIYKAEVNKNNLMLKPYINFKELSGYYPFLLKTIFSRQGGRFIKYPLDLEGITYCDDTWYLVNEQARQIIKIQNNQIEVLDVNFSKIFEQIGYSLPEMKTNAGLEGIAIDCNNGIIYLAQEREPRKIIVLNLTSLKLVDFFDIPAIRDDYPDFSDLYFENNHLYILERNHYLITKIDPTNKKIIQRISFSNLDNFQLKSLYKTTKKFGMAEGLTMDRKSIYICLDNNKTKLSEEAKNTFRVKKGEGVLLKFERPVNF